MSSLMPFVVWRYFAREYQPQWSWTYRVRDLQGAIFVRRLRIWFLVCLL